MCFHLRSRPSPPHMPIVITPRHRLDGRRTYVVRSIRHRGISARMLVADMRGCRDRIRKLPPRIQSRRGRVRLGVNRSAPFISPSTRTRRLEPTESSPHGRRCRGADQRSLRTDPHDRITLLASARSTVPSGRYPPENLGGDTSTVYADRTAVSIRARRP